MSTVTTFLNLVKPAPLENFSRATYNNNLDILDARAVTVEKMAKGLMWYHALAGDTGALSTLVVIDNVPSFTFLAGRKYRVGWVAEYTVSNPDTKIEVSIQRAATTDAAALTTGLTKYNRHTVEAMQAGLSVFFNHAFIHTPAATETVQVKFLAERVAGTGTFTLSGAAVARPVEVFIEDLGAQF